MIPIKWDKALIQYQYNNTEKMLWVLRYWIDYMEFNGMVDNIS